jgi:acetate---CoA ligase (ADP-forming)
MAPVIVLNSDQRQAKLALLQWSCGQPVVGLKAIEEGVLCVYRLVEEIPEISELDLNPIFALPPGQDCRILDARIRVRK